MFHTHSLSAAFPSWNAGVTSVSLVQQLYVLRSLSAVICTCNAGVCSCLSVTVVPFPHLLGLDWVAKGGLQSVVPLLVCHSQCAAPLQLILPLPHFIFPSFTVPDRQPGV
mmetsp:Transcript_8899/g.22439  ORF Transcript_8899/g.22439 Transcript_8899/m.22439 type:complete len:110 (+) Transcript_8899:1651-1980(+)